MSIGEQKTLPTDLPASATASQTTIKRKKMAFIRKGVVPIANKRTSQYLHTQYPHLELEIIDITDWMNSHRFIFFLSAIATFWEYAPDILTKKKRAKDCFWRTKFVFKIIKRVIDHKINARDYAFTFQMQSLFDASTSHVPHFIYTDHTNLENLAYPIVNPDTLYPQKCIDMEYMIYQNASMVFTRSHNITRSIVNEYNCPTEKVTCVYAGSNAPIDDSITLNNDHYTNKNILFVGIDWERKGGPELVEAFLQLLAEHPDAQLTIVGAEPEIDHPNVHVIGRVPIEEVSRHYQDASIFCLPTKLEPFGIAFIEALSHKLPIIGTNIGAIPDFIEHGRNGYLVEPYQVAELTAALKELLDDPEKCRQFGEYGNKMAVRHYNWDRVSERMATHINKILNNQG